MFNFFKKKEDPDALVISQLVKAGSNIEKPHNIEFFLYFPNQESVRKAELALQKEGRIFTITPSSDDVHVLCQITIAMAPELNALQNTRLEFTRIASEYNGIYDGWGAEIVK